MIKDNFKKWCFLKEKLNFKKSIIYAKHKEIWYVSLWKNIWYESNWKWQDFKRPVLILKRFWTMFLVVSMTTKWKINNFYYKLNNNYFNKNSYIVLSQIKTIDSRRFIEKIWKISTNDFLDIKNKIKKLF